MGKDQRFPLRNKILARGIIPDRVSLALKIMMLSCPSVVPTIVTPRDGTVPIHLFQCAKVTVRKTADS